MGKNRGRKRKTSPEMRETEAGYGAGENLRPFESPQMDKGQTIGWII